MKKTIIALFSLAILAGCGQANIALTGNHWNEKESYGVKGRNGILVNQKLSFGEFHTSSIDRSWTKGSVGYTGIGTGSFTRGDYLNIIGMEYVNKKQTLRFSLEDEEASPSSVFCVSRFRSRDLLVGDDKGLLGLGIDLLELKGRNAGNIYYAQIYTDPGSEPWQMMVDNDLVQRQPKYYRGIVAKSRTEYYTIVPVTTVTKRDGEVIEMPFGSMGLEIRNSAGLPLAAVNMADNGQVYFVRGLNPEEKFLLANICTALLLQETIG